MGMGLFMVTTGIVCLGLRPVCVCSGDYMYCLLRMTAGTMFS